VLPLRRDLQMLHGDGLLRTNCACCCLPCGLFATLL
jgi:hypothetical protein